MSSKTFAACALATLLCQCLTSAQHVVSFDSATATSTFPSGAFAAADAIAPGSGYWCSSGSHTAGASIAWTGVASLAHKATGVSINWAYGPGEFRVLTSPDGGNFEEATAWRAAGRAEAAYSETVLFGAPRTVKALAIVMRSPKSSGYFGISDVALLTQPGASMLVADAERCFAADGKAIGVVGCLEATARGSGEEIFRLSPTSQLVSAASGDCVTVAQGKVTLQDCDEAADAGDGRSIFALTPSSKLTTQNGFCLAATAAGAAVVPCSADQGEVTMVAVPEVNAAQASKVQDAAALLRAAVARQQSLLQQLKTGLGACKGLAQGNWSDSQQVALASAAHTRRLAVTGNPAAEASLQIDAAAGVDLTAVKGLIADSKAALARAS